MAAALSSSIYNPLDCLKVRWQVLPTTATTETSLASFGYKIVTTEGLVNGLWKPGLCANAIGMGLSSGIRFACYAPLRNALVGNDEKKSYEHMVIAGLISGCLGYSLTTPFHLIKTSIQAQMSSSTHGRPTDFMTRMQQIVREQGFASLYRGAIPLSSRGALFTAGQLMGTSYLGGMLLSGALVNSNNSCSNLLSIRSFYRLRWSQDIGQGQRARGQCLFARTFRPLSIILGQFSVCSCRFGNGKVHGLSRDSFELYQRYLCTARCRWLLERMEFVLCQIDAKSLDVCNNV